LVSSPSTAAESLGIACSEASGNLHVRFADRVVAIRAPCAVVLNEVAGTFGAMAVTECCGRLVGTVEARRAGRGFTVDADEGRKFDDPIAVARELYHAAARLLMFAYDDLVWVHAGAVAWGGGVHVLCGPSASGKSTIVGALLKRGWTYLSDEVAALDVAATHVYAFPLTPERRVHEGGPLRDAESVRSLPKVAIPVDPTFVAQGSLPLAAIHFLEYRPGITTWQHEPCAPGRAVLALLQNSLSLADDRRAEIAALAQLVSHVPAYELLYGDANAAAEYLHRSDPASSPRGSRTNGRDQGSGSATLPNRS
jgi:hypothetical protein